MKKLTCLLGLFVAFTSWVQAQILITPTGIDLNITPLWTEDNLIDNSGLSNPSPTFANYTTVTHAGSAASNSFTTFQPAGGGDYFTNGGTAPVFTIDLGDTYELTDIVFWGYTPGFGQNEPRNFDLEFSTTGTGGTFSGLQSIVSPSTLGTGTPPGTFALTSTVTANAVRLTVNSNQGGGRVGFGELKFVAVPEPSSYATLFGLVCLVAAFVRRRR